MKSRFLGRSGKYDVEVDFAGAALDVFETSGKK